MGLPHRSAAQRMVKPTWLQGLSPNEWPDQLDRIMQS